MGAGDGANPRASKHGTASNTCVRSVGLCVGRARVLQCRPGDFSAWSGHGGRYVSDGGREVHGGRAAAAGWHRSAQGRRRGSSHGIGRLGSAARRLARLWEWSIQRGSRGGNQKGLDGWLGLDQR